MKPIDKYRALQQKAGPAQVLAVTKYQSDDIVLQCVKDGISLIGESKAQDAYRKYKLLADNHLDVQLHMIGHLQTNKVADAIQIFEVIQSVDSEKLIRKIDNEIIRQGDNKKVQEIFLQLNLTSEEHKYGFEAGLIGEMISLCHSLPGISCTGLMCMGSLGDAEKTRSIYRTCRALCNEYTLPNCSMGMSADREIAIEEGATIIRIGSALFE